jgi:hypothetical protein
LSELLNTILSIVAMGATALGFVIQHYTTQASIQERLVTLEEQNKTQDKYGKNIEDLSLKLNTVCEEVSGLKIKTDVFWTAVQESVIGMLHHPDPEYAERDTLLDKLKAKTITVLELERLKELLKVEIRENRGSNESNAASLLLALISPYFADIKGIDNICRGSVL